MSNMFAVRKMSYQDSTMVNICDQELIGTRIIEGELEVNITKDYFGQQLVNEEEAGALLTSCSVANLVGKRIVDKAVGMKLATELSIRTISDVPFLMIFKFQHMY